jgi:hypothetical protein
MRKPLKIFFFASLALLVLSACTTYERKVTPFKMPEVYPNAVTVADASIAAKAYYDKEEAAGAFGFDIRGAGILPVQVVFDNNGSHPLEIIASKTFLVDAENNLWPILEQNLAYDRLSKATQLGRVLPEAGKGGLLAGAAGAVIGAAIGIVTGTNVGEAAGKGAAVGAAAGLTLGGTKGMADSDVRGQIQEDLQNHSLTTRAIAPHELAHGFIFYPGEAKKPVELRITIRTTDTNKFFPLTLRF